MRFKIKPILLTWKEHKYHYMENFIPNCEGNKMISVGKKEEDNIYLFFMSASLRPSMGASTVSTIALYPFLSTLWTSWAATSRFLCTYSQTNIRLQCDLLTTGSPIQRQRKQPKETVAAKEIYISLMKL